MPEKESVQYAVTFTLSNILRKLPAEDQYDTIRNHIMLDDEDRLFGLWKQTLICELTKNYDIHLHGIFSIKYSNLLSKYHKDPARYISDIVRKNKKYLGFCCIKQMTDYEGWVRYFSKDLRLTKARISRPPIIIDHHDVFPMGEFPLYFDDDITDEKTDEKTDEDTDEYTEDKKLFADRINKAIAKIERYNGT